MLVGPAVFGLVEPGEVLEVFAELGVEVSLAAFGDSTPCCCWPASRRSPS